MKPVVYVVVNKSLNMSPGKLAAQVGHAVAGALSLSQPEEAYPLHQWHEAPHRWIIVLEAENGEQLHHLREYLDDRNVPNFPVIDEGVNEIPAFSLTAVGVGILDKDSPEAGYLSGLPKYSTKREEDRQMQIAFRNGAASRKWRNRFLLPASSVRSLG